MVWSEIVPVTLRQPKKISCWPAVRSPNFPIRPFLPPLMEDSGKSLFASLPASSCNLDTLMNIWSSDRDAVAKRKHGESESDNDSDVVRRRRHHPKERPSGVFVLDLKGEWIDDQRETLRRDPSASAARHLWIPKQSNWLRNLNLRPHCGDVIIVLNRNTRRIAAVTKALADAEYFVPGLAGDAVAFPTAAKAEVVVRVEDLREQLLAPEKPQDALLQRVPKMNFRLGYARRLPDSFELAAFLTALNDS